MSDVGVLMGSVQFKGSVAEQLFKTIRPLSLITESYKHAICSNSPTVLLDSTKPHVTPIDEADRDEVKEFTSALKHDLSRLLLDEAAMDMDVLVRFPPRDPGGIEFDVQSNLRRELHYVTKNYKHYFSIVTALLYHMSVDFESTAK